MKLELSWCDLVMMTCEIGEIGAELVKKRTKQGSALLTSREFSIVPAYLMLNLFYVGKCIFVRSV